jgi:hypothetical protein
MRRIALLSAVLIGSVLSTVAMAQISCGPTNIQVTPDLDLPTFTKSKTAGKWKFQVDAEVAWDCDPSNATESSTCRLCVRVRVWQKVNGNWSPQMPPPDTVTASAPNCGGSSEVRTVIIDPVDPGSIWRVEVSYGVSTLSGCNYQIGDVAGIGQDFTAPPNPP